MVEISIGEQELNSLFHSKNNLKDAGKNKKFIKKSAFAIKTTILKQFVKEMGTFRIKWEC